MRTCLGLGDEVEPQVELGERAVEGQRVGLALDGLRVLVEGALLVIHVEEDLGELEVRRAVVVAVADVGSSWIACSSGGFASAQLVGPFTA